MTWIEKTADSLANPTQSYRAALTRWEGKQRATKPYPSDFGLHTKEPEHVPLEGRAEPVHPFHSKDPTPTPPPAETAPELPEKPRAPTQPKIPKLRAPRVAPVAPPAGPRPPPPPLLPQQRGAADFIVKHDGQGILAHVTGAGKTRSAVEGFQALKARGKAHKAIVITPAGLRTNFAEEGVRRFTNESVSIIGSSGERGPGYAPKDKPDPNATYHVISYEMFKSDPEGFVKRTGADTIIMDELHRVKDPSGQTFKSIRQARPLVRNMIGMTGSLVSTHPSNILQPIDLVTGGQHGFGNPAEFDRRFLKRNAPKAKLKDYVSPAAWFSWLVNSKGTAKPKGEIVGWNRPDELRQRLSDVVHYVGPESVQGQMPKKVVETVRVEMSPMQEQTYRAALREMPAPMMHKVEHGGQMNEEDEVHVFNRLVKARQVANSMHTMTDMSLAESAAATPKLQKMLDDLEDHLHSTPDGQAIIYTNLVHGGVDIIREGLKQRGIEHGVFIGKGNDEVTEESRQQDVQDYKAGKKKVIVVSGAGNEGVSLPNTTFHAAYDGHFNPEKVLQAEARGVRAGGQAHRSQGDRQVVVRRYMTVYPESKTFFGKTHAYFKGQAASDSVDNWIYNRADLRHNLNQQLYDIVQGRPITHHTLFPEEKMKGGDNPRGWWPFSKKSEAVHEDTGTRRQADADLHGVGGHEGTLLEPQTRSLEELWGARDQGLRPLAHLRELLRGHGGSAIPRSNTGTEGSHGGLLPGERILGNLSSSSPEPAQHRVDRVPGRDPLPRGLGQAGRVERDINALSTQALGQGAGVDYPQDRQQWAPAGGAFPGSPDSISPLGGLDIPSDRKALNKIATLLVKVALETEHGDGAGQRDGQLDVHHEHRPDVDSEHQSVDRQHPDTPVLPDRPAYRLNDHEHPGVSRTTPTGAATSRVRVSLHVPPGVRAGRARVIARMVKDALEQVSDFRKVSCWLDGGSLAVEGILHVATDCSTMRSRLEEALQSVVDADPKASLDDADPAKIHLKVAALIDSPIEGGATIGQGPKKRDWADKGKDAPSVEPMAREEPVVMEDSPSDVPTEKDWQKSYSMNVHPDVPQTLYHSDATP